MTENISIHALRGEGDKINRRQFTHSLIISIHALRGEGDRSHVHRIRLYRHFNPRPPWGGRRITPIANITIPPFQSTPSVGRATRGRSFYRRYKNISIHALRGEGDRSGMISSSIIQRFQSTPSVGRATQPKATARYTLNTFQSTPSVGRATLTVYLCHWCHNISIHALRGEGDYAPRVRLMRLTKFQSTPSVGRATATIL